MRVRRSSFLPETVPPHFIANITLIIHDNKVNAKEKFEVALDVMGWYFTEEWLYVCTYVVHKQREKET